MKILVVDDSKTIRYVLQKTLSELGYSDVVEAADVSQARGRIARDRPDLIISDINMPGESGIDLLQHVRDNPSTADIPFVIISANQDKKQVFRAAKIGLQDYILKPIDKRTLAEKLKTLSQSHGIQAPSLATKPAPRPAPPPQPGPETNDSTPEKEAKDENADASTLVPRNIDAVIEHCGLIFDGELTVNDFRMWLATELLGLGEDAADSEKVTDLLGRLKSASQEGVRRAFAAAE